MSNCNIRGRPYSVNRFGSAEKGWANFFPGKVTDNLGHPQTIALRKGLSECFFVDVLIGIEAHHQSVTLLTPLSQLGH